MSICKDNRGEEAVADLLFHREQFKVVTETAAPAFMPHVKFIKALPTHPECQPIPIRYVATLDPPVPVSDEVCQKLMNATGLSSLDTVSQVPYSPSTMSLEDMLVMNVADTVSFSNNWVSVSSSVRCIYKRRITDNPHHATVI